jgi:hypothetical protein
MRPPRFELSDQLLVGDAVLQHRHPAVTDRAIRVQRGKDLPPGIGLWHPDLRRETKLAQLSDRLGPTRDQRRTPQRRGEALGRAALRERIRERTHPHPGHHHHHVDLASLQPAQQLQRHTVVLERHFAHRRHHQRHATVATDQAGRNEGLRLTRGLRVSSSSRRSSTRLRCLAPDAILHRDRW